MRDRSRWHQTLTAQLRPVWPSGLGSFGPGELLDVELGLYVLETLMPGRVALDAWTLFGGYPYGEAFGDIATRDQRVRIRRARHFLWGMRRHREWRLALEAYLQVPQELRGYDVDAIDAPPVRRCPARAPQRFERFDRLLTEAPAFARAPLPMAQAGEYWFPVRDRRYSVTFAEDLIPVDGPRGHDLQAMPTGRGEPVEVSWAELQRAAQRMDELEAATPGGKGHDWVRRLDRVHLLVRDEAKGEFVERDRLRIDRLLNLVGMVGAGKSTLRDILAFWAATERGLRITIVVGDVAETLAVVDLFDRLKVPAAPIIGHSTREKHIQRLHRRLATAGAPTLLSHDHPSFGYLSSACPLDALRGLEAERPLRVGEAPCVLLFPAAKPTASAVSVLDDALENDYDEEPGRRPDASKVGVDQRPRRHACPLWANCPRHIAARGLVDAQIWVATPASLVHSGLPQHMNAERLRYLELACRSSDLVLVDEADRVQMQLDTAFAPATTLAGRSPNSWLDEVANHKVAELAKQGRLQLSAREVDDWTSAVDTVNTATDRLYALLISNGPLLSWITEDYFSAFTLHQWLINSWFPELKRTETDPASGTDSGVGLAPDRERSLRRIEAVLDRFRDDPLQERMLDDDDDEVAPLANQLVHLTLELLHVRRGAATKQRVRTVLAGLLGRDTTTDDGLDAHVTRFEFTLVLAALHHRLNIMTAMWPRVEAALNLEATSNVLSRRPPKDYEPVIPESPMGNVLGFQFYPGERNKDGDQSGELRFFRCSGVGRELLLELPDLPAIDGRPGPNVLLMSATSWAGTSSRYHVHTDVGAVLRPHPEEVEAILGTTFRKQFLYWPTTTDATPKALRLSGSEPDQRPKVLTEMLRQLAVPDRNLAGSVSLLDAELADIDDPDRRRILLLVGSYDEAKHAAEYLNAIPEWTGRITQLVSDDADLDNAWAVLRPTSGVRTLRRGDVATFPATGGDILIAPLLAIERGHNIVVAGGKAAIASVYFLARPHPRPDDITLAIQAINDWAVRQVRGPDREFHKLALAAGSPHRAGLAFRSAARKKWNRFLTRRLSWTSLPDEEKTAFTWDQLVVMWQVIGRLVRGGVPARVVFVDAAFSPREAGLKAVDTPATSLLTSMRHLLAPYFSAASAGSSIDRSLVKALYEPLYQALAEMD